MCIPADPNALATTACVLCSRVRQQPACHHLRAICTQRQNHPGHNNISYFTNAEYDIFNGCGFCKFAALAGGKIPAGKNRGYPGCCRPPTDADADLIQDSFWPAVAAFWKVPIPEKVLRRISPRSLQQLQLRKEDGGSPTTSKLSLKTAIPSTPSDRKPSPPTPGRGNSKITSSPTDTIRRSVEPSRSGIPSFPPSARSSQIRASGSSGNGRSGVPNPIPQVTVTIDQSDGLPPPPPPKPAPGPSPSQYHPHGPEDIAKSFARMGVSRPASYDPGKRNSIGSMSSLSEATGSDFTDYLSDASDQRIQREAEERVTQKFEEREFYQARSKVAGMDLEPPDLWGGSRNGRYGPPVPVAGGRRSH
ncbi:hypothetical protein CALCODRAFT_146126 [Calocera cornea HHB12733]|uniref:Uncharacterized protein n=1 Tax=Calocera cornea HHB12733 TaxID=1353952 RepID=A0A165CRJ4_9BASI|nr:hypothetical protein CALCODRAFT_146126 [Calocera cornea HHB12733]